MKVTLRPWKVTDAVFACYVRNDIRLIRWFRQSKKIELEEQQKFIQHDIRFRDYNGNVIEADGKPVGLCGVKDTQEFTLAVLPEYQKKGIATKAMHLLMKKHPQMWSEVFSDNPALSWYLRKLGFKVVGVEERAYYKPDIGMIDVIKIAHD